MERKNHLYSGIFRIIVLCFLTLVSMVATQCIAMAQTIKEPTILISLSSERAKIYSTFKISWKCLDPSVKDPENNLESRYRLDVPGDWMGGIKYHVSQWSDYYDGNTMSLTINNFIITGEYKITVQCRNKITKKVSKAFSKTFIQYWEEPAIQEEAFNIDWDLANRAPTLKAKYQILAEEYEMAYNMWYRDWQNEADVIKATTSYDKLVLMYTNVLIGKWSKDQMIELLSKSSQGVVKKVLVYKSIYDLIKQGAFDLILIYRNVQANKAYSMTIVSYYAWKLFEQLANEQIDYVQIGNQIWMKQNLNVGKFITSDQNQTNNNEIEKYCYDNIEANCQKYGGLYQWDEMMNYNSSTSNKGICPDGWHIPTQDDWKVLRSFLGEKPYTKILVGLGNESGFSAILSGVFFDSYSRINPATMNKEFNEREFYGLNKQTMFWSSTKDYDIGTDAKYINDKMIEKRPYPVEVWIEKNYLSIRKQIESDGYSIRCVKD